MKKLILKELKEIKKLLQVIVSNQEQGGTSSIQEKIKSDEEYYIKMIKGMVAEYRTLSGICPDQISLVAKAESRTAELWINLI